MKEVLDPIVLTEVTELEHLTRVVNTEKPAGFSDAEPAVHGEHNPDDNAPVNEGLHDDEPPSNLVADNPVWINELAMAKMEKDNRMNKNKRQGALLLYLLDETRLR